MKVFFSDELRKLFSSNCTRYPIQLHWAHHSAQGINNCWGEKVKVNPQQSIELIQFFRFTKKQIVSDSLNNGVISPVFNRLHAVLSDDANGEL